MHCSRRTSIRRRRLTALAGCHLLDEPQLRASLTELLREAPTGKQPTWRRVWPLLVSTGSALVMLLASFIPSIQEQWDRFQARQVIERYKAARR